MIGRKGIWGTGGEGGMVEWGYGEGKGDIVGREDVCGLCGDSGGGWGAGLSWGLKDLQGRGV